MKKHKIKCIYINFWSFEPDFERKCILRYRAVGGFLHGFAGYTTVAVTTKRERDTERGGSIQVAVCAGEIVLETPRLGCVLKGTVGLGGRKRQS